MVGVMMGMLMSLGGAAAVLTVLARRNAPRGGWRQALQSGVHAARAKELPLVDAATEDAPAGGLDELFEIGERPEGPVYSEATAVQHVLERARQRSPMLARIIPHT